MAEIEDYIYGNSQDSFDNYDRISGTLGKLDQNKHTFGGVLNRLENLQSTCRSNQHALDLNRRELVLYC